MQLFSAADALYSNVSLQVPSLQPEAKGESVSRLGPGTSVFALSSLHPDSPRDRVDMGGCRRELSPPSAELAAGLCSRLGG